MSEEREEFSVYVWSARAGPYSRELSFVSAERALACARWRAYEYGVERIIITDGGDHTVFDWRAGEGVIFPPPQAD